MKSFLAPRATFCFVHEETRDELSSCYQSIELSTVVEKPPRDGQGIVVEEPFHVDDIPVVKTSPGRF